MVAETIVADLFVGGVSFALGTIFAWLTWLTIRHYNYGKPAYETLAGTELGEGHLEETGDRFSEIEAAHEDMRHRVSNVGDRVSDVERKVDTLDEKFDRNYRLLQKLAEVVGVDAIFYRGGPSESGDD